MGGRGPEVGQSNGFSGWLKGGRERQIRPAVRQEKPLRRVRAPVPQTDTGGRDEYSQALGWWVVQEL